MSWVNHSPTPTPIPTHPKSVDVTDNLQFFCIGVCDSLLTAKRSREGSVKKGHTTAPLGPDVAVTKPK